MKSLFWQGRPSCLDRPLFRNHESIIYDCAHEEPGKGMVTPGYKLSDWTISRLSRDLAATKIRSSALDPEAN